MEELTREKRDRLRHVLAAHDLTAAARDALLPVVSDSDPESLSPDELADLLLDDLSGAARVPKLVEFLLTEAAARHDLGSVLELPREILDDDPAAALGRLEAALGLPADPGRTSVDTWEKKLLAPLRTSESPQERLQLACLAFVRAAKLADQTDDLRIGEFWDQAQHFLTQLNKVGVWVQEPVAQEVRRRAKWCIETLTIENVRRFPALTWHTPAGAECGQWLFLLGENGTGKSGLLQAVALACSRQGVTRHMR